MACRLSRRWKVGDGVFTRFCLIKRRNPHYGYHEPSSLADRAWNHPATLWRKKNPELFGELGKGLAEFKKATREAEHDEGKPPSADNRKSTDKPEKN
jgi:hypothetical protein